MSGVYTTAARTKILDYLKDNSAHMISVVEIRDHLHSIDHDVNITTIYRYLDKLVDDGVLLKYNNDKGTQAVYQYVEPDKHCEEHLHLKCTACGAVVHLDCSFMHEISEHIKREHGFMIQCKNSIIYGLCSNCAAKNT